MKLCKVPGVQSTGTDKGVDFSDYTSTTVVAERTAYRPKEKKSPHLIRRALSRVESTDLNIHLISYVQIWPNSTDLG